MDGYICLMEKEANDILSVMSAASEEFKLDSDEQAIYERLQKFVKGERTSRELRESQS